MELDNTIISMVATAILFLLGGVALAAFAYWRRQINDTRLGKYVDWAVEAAEQQMAHMPGQMRRQWVIDQLKARLPWLDEEFAKLLIESAVLRVNQSKSIKTTVADEPAGPPEWRGQR